MGKRMREIGALALVALLGLGAVCAMAWYLFAGHGWNVAASNIDDSFGQMEGYTVVLFEGTRQLPMTQKVDGDSASNASSAVATESSEDPQGSNNAADEVAQEPMVVDIELSEDQLSLQNLAESYRAKGAEVYCLAVDEPWRYREPFVVSKGTRRIGLAQVSAPARPAAVRMAQKLLARQQADFTIVMTDDPTLQEGILGALDVLICNNVDAEPLKGRYEGSVFCVDTPFEGEIGALIVSPSGVLSSKTIGAS